RPGWPDRARSSPRARTPAGRPGKGALCDNRDEGCPWPPRLRPKTRRSPACSFPTHSRRRGRYRPGAPCSAPSPSRRAREQWEYAGAVSIRDLPAGLLAALGADLAHGGAEMLRADDKALEGCGAPGLGRQQVADRGKACLAADEFDIGTAAPLARTAGQCREIDVGGQWFAARVYFENLQSRLRIGQGQFQHEIETARPQQGSVNDV